MPDYRRNRVPEGIYFFTVNVLERRNRLLIEHIDTLREVVRRVRAKHSFYIDALVVLLDYTHCICTLPPGDMDYSTRWKAIKIAFAKSIPKKQNGCQGFALLKASEVFGKGVFGSIQFRDERDYIADVDYVHQALACATRYRLAIFIFSSICYGRYLSERLGGS